MCKMGLKKSSKPFHERMGVVAPEDAPFIKNEPEKLEVNKEAEVLKTSENITSKNKQKPKKITAEKVSKKPIRLAFCLPFPVAGLSEKYDSISAVANENKAFGVVLTLAIEDYEKSLLENNPAPAKPEYEYETTEQTFSTKRNISSDAYDIACKHFDPVGYLKPFAISNMIARTALAAYFQKNK